ncbi:MAG: hypothetical protein MJ239_00650 [Bacilli bacterium]|nr:hypothetical protein [Bacilli bacterium]
MCTSFVFNGDDVIVGFNFDFNDNVQIKVKAKPEFVYGVFRDKDTWAVPFGVSKDGQFGNVLMVPPSDKENRGPSSQRLDKLVEDYIYSRISFDQVVEVLNRFEICNAAGWSLHSQLSDRHGRTLIIEPGRGWKEREERYNVLSNFSFFEPLATKDVPFAGYDRYLKASEMLKDADDSFSVEDAFEVLKNTVIEKGEQGFSTRVSLVYSVGRNQVFWCMDQQFDNIHSHRF